MKLVEEGWCERGLREIAKLSSEEYPQLVQCDIYVDDCLSGEENVEKVFKKKQRS